MTNDSHFGFKTVDRNVKKSLVDDVFSAVSDNYDVMNDVMSFGLHRLWKDYFVNQLNLKHSDKILDLAAGTGDITKRMHTKLSKAGQLIIADYNLPMLKQGHDRLLNEGILHQTCVVDGHHLPFKDNEYHHIVISFGLRNMADHETVLNSCLRTLKPGGCLSVLEFSHTEHETFSKIYDWYSFNLIPQFGQWFAQSKDSYQYLVESIRMHPKAPELQATFDRTGFKQTSYEFLTGGIVAIHRGIKA